MSLWGAAILTSPAGFSTTVLKDCSRGLILQTVTCPETVIGVCQDILPVEYFCSNRASLFGQTNFKDLMGM